MATLRKNVQSWQHYVNRGNTEKMLVATHSYSAVLTKKFMFHFQYNFLCCTDNLKAVEIKENTVDPVISENNISEIKITGDLVQLKNRLPVWPCQPRTGAEVLGATILA